MKKYIFLFNFIFVSSSYAANFSISTEAPPVQLTGVVNNDTIDITTTRARSYCCGMNNTISVTNGRFVSISTNDAITKVRGLELPIVSSGGANAEQRRICWYELDTSNFLATSSLVFGNITGSISPHVSCEETTLYGNYNTSVSEFNFLELTGKSSIGTSAGNISGVVKFQSSVTGNVTSTNFTITFDNQTTSKRVDISVHDLIGNVADFGALTIRHDGAPGQLSARISYYDITSTSPLDFTLVGQADFRRGSLGK